MHMHMHMHMSLVTGHRTVSNIKGFNTTIHYLLGLGATAHGSTIRTHFHRERLFINTKWACEGTGMPTQATR
jgi:hypothetical protein